MENFLYVNWHNTREITVIETTEKFQIRLQKQNDEEKVNIDKAVFREFINMNWTKIVFHQLAFSQTPSEFIYKPPANEDEGLKFDSRFTTIIFHHQRKFLQYSGTAIFLELFLSPHVYKKERI